MKKLHSRKLTKQVLLTIAILMLCNFAMPKFSYARTDTQNGGKIFDPLMKFVTYLCDETMQWLQNKFTSLDDIENGDGTYNFQYSPGRIFSGTVPALSIDFMGENHPTITSAETSLTKNIIKNDIKQHFNHATSITEESYNSGIESDGENPDYSYFWDSFTKSISETVMYTAYYSNTHVVIYFKIVTSGPSGAYTSGYKKCIVDNIASTTYESIAAKLQGSISTWYSALRRISLVGLLSVLLYIGIRIVALSVSGKDNSKYKKMLTDWLVAICLLFTLHYLMNLIVVVVQKICEIFPVQTTDPLMDGIREDIRKAGSWGASLGSVIIYVVLTIYTIVFTIKYMIRVIYMAFFTMIAPLITLTYPLDKIKDNKAQAFNMWLREYVFNALIQVVHLLLYFVFVSSAMSLVNAYPIYAIVVIGFMTQAEKLIRKMFGFDNVTSIGTVGAAAMGGLITSALNKLKTPPKDSKGKEESSKDGDSKKDGNSNSVRTAKTDPLAGQDPKPQQGETSPEKAGTRTVEGQGTQGNNQDNNDNKPDMERAEMFRRLMAEGMTQEEAVNRVNAELPLNRNENKAEATEKNEQTNTGKAGRILKGVKALAGKYVGPNIKPMMKTVAGGLLGATGMAIGFAAGVAQGDVGKAITGGLAGGAAGYYTGQKAVDGTEKAIDKAVNIDKPIKDVIKTFKEASEEDNK